MRVSCTCSTEMCAQVASTSSSCCPACPACCCSTASITSSKLRQAISSVGPSSLCACQCLLSPSLKACTRPRVCEYPRCGAANSAEQGQARAIERSKSQRTDYHDPRPIPLPKSSSLQHQLQRQGRLAAARRHNTQIGVLNSASFVRLLTRRAARIHVGAGTPVPGG